nr:2Fe-2S iron-sulfur cluster binding domain-containing protein [Deltaproteobacteria bacterium]
VIHYVLLVKADLRQPLVFGAVIAALLGYRIVRHYLDLRREVKTAHAKLASAKAAAPAPTRAKNRKFWAGELRVARIFDETPDVKTFRMVSPSGGPLPFDHVAGQYLNLALTIDGKRVNRSYTIASSPTRADYCEISVKRAADGYASAHLHATLREGSILKVSAPAGRFVFTGTGADRVILVAGGVGITPMMSIVRSLTDRCWTGDMYLVFSVRKLHDVIFANELTYLQQRFPNLHVCVTLTSDPDQAWDGERGQISAAMLRRAIPDLTRGPVLLCGPDKMMDAMRALLVGLGVPDAEVAQEAFVSPPSAPEGTAAPAAQPVELVTEGEVASVRFQRSNVSAELPAGLTLLEAAEEAGVTIPFECRSGICGQCKTRLVTGKVTMDVQDALTATDRSKGLILACQARALGDVVVDV